MPMGIPPRGSDNVGRLGPAQGRLEITGKKRLHGRLHRLDSRFESAEDIDRVKGPWRETLPEFRKW